MSRQQHRARQGPRQSVPGRDGAVPAAASGSPAAGSPAAARPVPARPAPARPAPDTASPHGDQTDHADQAALTVDALGKKCPIPIIMLADRIREVPVGQTIEVLADDPAARTDLPAWCSLKSQEFVRAQPLTVGWSFLIRRSY